MRRLLAILLLSLTAAGAYACGGAATEPAAPAADEVCPLVDAGPPPVCPEGCDWNGKECRKKGGIIVYDNKVRIRDGGADAHPTQ